MSIVYWVHLPSQQDMFSEGYVGISTQTLEERKREHCTQANSTKAVKYIFQKAINKYKDELVWEVIVEADIDYCQDIERKLRPEPRIGWNIATGGGAPCYKRIASEEERRKASERMSGENNPFFGRKHSDESKLKQSLVKLGKKMGEEFSKKMSLISKGRKYNLTQEQRDAIGERGRQRVITEEFRKRQSEILKEATPRGWEAHKANKDIWAMIPSLFEFFKDNPEKGIRAISSVFSVKPHQLGSILKRFRAGWNPEEDTDYISWRESYLLNKENNGT